MTVTTWESIFEPEELSPEQELIRQLREANRRRHREMVRQLREGRPDPGVTNVMYGRQGGPAYGQQVFNMDDVDVDAQEIVEELEQSGSDDEQEDSSRFGAIVAYLQGIFTND